jgi:hypothetical protein
MKKLFAILTVFIFLAGIASTGLPKAAMAANNDNAANSVDVKKLTSDITDKDTKDAVLRLAAFGIVNGMEDGKYHPDDTVTREQFAKILVTSLKMDAAAKAAMGRSSFKDVEASRWSAGYINVAAGQGLIKGYPDGTFQPAKQVSYAEAITMLVRALGYKDEFLPGNWPGNYLAKAAEEEITKYVKFNDVSGGANRGDVAILVNNTLDANVVKVDTYEASGTKYYESDKTLLEDKLNITKYENTRIIANNRLDDSLDDNEVSVYFIKDTEDGKYESTDDADFEFIEGFNAETIMGEEVTIYLNDDDEIIYAEREYDDDAKFDYVEGDVEDNNGKVAKVSLVKFDDDYEFDDDAVVYVTQGGETTKVTPEDEESGFFNGMVGKVVMKNDKIVFADFMDVTEEIDNWMIVKGNEDGILNGISMDDDSMELDLTEDGNYDGVIILDLEGNTLSIDDIEEGNLLYVAKADIDGDDYAIVRVVTNNILEGTLEKVKYDRISIDDKEIKFTKVGDDIRASYSIDNGDTITIYDFNNDPDVQADMEDADNQTIKAYTDAVGRISYFVTEAEAVSGYKYGIVTRIYTDSDKLKIYTVTENGEGDEITYSVEDSDNIEYGIPVNEYGIETSDNATEEIVPGSVVKFKLNKDGEIAEDEIYVFPKPDSDDGTNAWVLTKDFGKDSITAKYDNSGSDKSFSVDSSTVIIDAKYLEEATGSSKLDPHGNFKSVDDNFSVIDWEDIAEDDIDTSPFYVFLDDNGVDVKAIVFFGDGVSDAAEDEEAIYVIDKWYKGGDLYAKIHRYGKDVEDIVVDSGSEFGFKDERPYIAKVQADGELEVVSGTDFAAYYGIITDKDSSTITVEVYGSGEKTFRINSSTLVYEEDTKKSTSNLHEDDAVYVIVEDGVNARVIERLIDDEKQDVLDNKSPY